MYDIAYDVCDTSTLDDGFTNYKITSLIVYIIKSIYM